MQVPAFAEMFARLHEGKPDSWGALLSQLAPRLIAYFERLGIDHHFAEDLTQEVLATVYRKLDELRDPARFGSWVRMIARNRMRSRMRRMRFTEILEESDPVEVRDALWRLHAADLRRLVGEEVQRLGPNARRMLELKLLEDRSPSEIAAIMGIPRDLFRRRFHVAIKALRQRMTSRIGDVADARARADSHRASTADTRRRVLGECP
jgi:RNA polymerase sigma-70 factor (ECF subfamily)